MRNRKILAKLLAVLLVLTVAIIPTLVTPLADSSVYDYSKEGSYFNTEKNTADIVEMVTGSPLSDAEYNYLAKYGKLKAKYEDVTTQGISVSVTAAGVEVTALAYTYTAKNGSSVTWVPVSAVIGDNVIDFTASGDSYTADFGDVEIDDDSTVKVNYELGVDFLFSKDDINEALNLAYNNAPAIKSAYDAAVSKQNAYNSYLEINGSAVDEYLEKKDLYREYLSAKMLYDEAKREYDAYLEEKAIYEEQNALYSEYIVKLTEYRYALDYNNNYETVHLPNYNKELAEYNAYIDKLALIDEQIDMLDTALFKRVTSLERQLYSAIFSGLVDIVIEYKALCNLAGVKLEVVNDCAKATGVLRSILKEYKSLKTDTDKYSFYVNNYEALKDNIILLARTLENFFANDFIRSMIYKGGTVPGTDITIEPKGEQFSIFIAQLILFANCLSDEPVYKYEGNAKLDKTTKITLSKKSEVKTPIQILENNEYIKDTNKGAPVDGGYPQAMEKPTEPVKMDVPPEPQEVQKPIEPDVVAEPTAPAVVTEPTAPDGYLELILTESEKAYVNSSIYAALVRAYNNGELVLREEVSEDFTYTPVSTVEKKLSGTDTVTVTFADANGDTILFVTVDKNSSANFTGTLPTKAADISADYIFDAWVDADGKPYNLANVTENITLYPTFKPVYKKYNVENVGGVSMLNVDISGNNLTNLPLEHFTNIATSNNVGMIVTADNITVKITLSTLTELANLDVVSLDFEVEKLQNGAYTCKISTQNSQGRKVDTAATFNLAIPCTDEAFARSSKLFATDADGSVTSCRKNNDGAIVKFSAKADVDYLICIKHDIHIDPAAVTHGIQLSADSAMLGEVVSIEITGDIPVGKTLALYYYDADGKHYIENNSFIMPKSSVTVGAELTDIIYTITFMSDDKIISIAKYKYGQQIVIPRDPAKQDDDLYSYTFKGWSSEVSEIAVADAVYVAEYEATPLPVEDQGDVAKVKRQVFWLRFAIVLLVLLPIVAIALTVFLVIRHKRRKACALVHDDNTGTAVDSGEEKTSEEKCDDSVDSKDVKDESLNDKEKSSDSETSKQDTGYSNYDPSKIVLDDLFAPTGGWTDSIFSNDSNVSKDKKDQQDQK